MRLLPLFIIIPIIALTALPQAQGQDLDCLASKRHRHGSVAKGGGVVELWPMDILHQRVEVDLTTPGTLLGRCQVTATPRSEALDALSLHLLQFTVDSVTSAEGQLAYTHTDELLVIDLATTYDPGDTVTVEVHYGGLPATDPSGFGGFYFAGQYLYNLGVAFTSIPHSYGRAWFPCVDNFTERNTYDFVVRTDNTRNAWCNGALISDEEDGTSRVRHWRLENTIPAYLAAIAAAPYTFITDSYTSITGSEVPVQLAALPADTANLRASFANLPISFTCFEDWFGPYRWNKVGYVLTPLGAMEHATSIHYPRSIANGSLQREDVMAHELGHEWFGNVITCERAEEMYLNEGFAEYLSYLFYECTYGYERYMQAMRTNHRNMLLRAHLNDEGWWALADVPQEWTYGEHSYNKAAAFLHSLRTYLGDDNFRTGLTTFIEDHAFQPVNSIQLRDHLSQTTGVDLTDYFADWIFQPGWAAFEVDSFTTSTAGAAFSTTVYVQQKQRGPAQPYRNVPLRVGFQAADGTLWNAPEPVLVGEPLSSFTVEVPFIPVEVLLNTDEGLSLAVTYNSDTLTANSGTTYALTDIRITAYELDQPVPVRIEEYWVAADPETEEGFAYQVSPDRWWRILGALPQEANITGRIQYDGRPIAAGSFDAGLMQDAAGVTFREDSLVLLYRPDQRSPWRVHPDFTVNILGNPTDKLGRIDFTGVWAGEYTLAWRKSAVGMTDADARPSDWLVHPNPSTDHITISWRGDERAGGLLELVDAAGRRVAHQRIDGLVTVLSVRGMPPGTYLLRHVPLQGPAEVVDRVVVAR